MSKYWYRSVDSEVSYIESGEKEVTDEWIEYLEDVDEQWKENNDRYYKMLDGTFEKKKEDSQSDQELCFEDPITQLIDQSKEPIREYFDRSDLPMSYKKTVHKTEEIIETKLRPAQQELIYLHHGEKKTFNEIADEEYEKNGYRPSKQAVSNRHVRIMDIIAKELNTERVIHHRSKKSTDESKNPTDESKNLADESKNLADESKNLADESKNPNDEK